MEVLRNAFLSGTPLNSPVWQGRFLQPPLLFSRKRPQVLSYLADQLQGVPGSVPRPDNRQGWLIIWQTEPGWSEIFMDPNVAVRIVLVDAGQDHFFFPLR